MFGVLYQFFQTTLNIIDFKNYFESSPGPYYPYEPMFGRLDVRLMDNFVKTIQSELGWKGKFKPKDAPPYLLNFEMDYVGSDKYDGSYLL